MEIYLQAVGKIFRRKYLLWTCAAILLAPALAISSALFEAGFVGPLPFYALEISLVGLSISPGLFLISKAKGLFSIVIYSFLGVAAALLSALLIFFGYIDLHDRLPDAAVTIFRMMPSYVRAQARVDRFTGALYTPIGYADI